MNKHKAGEMEWNIARTPVEFIIKGAGFYSYDAVIRINRRDYVIRVTQEKEKSVFCFDGKYIKMGCLLSEVEGQPYWMYCNDYKRECLYVPNRVEGEWRGLEYLAREVRFLYNWAEYHFCLENWVKKEIEEGYEYEKKMDDITLKISENTKTDDYRIYINGDERGEGRDMERAVNMSLKLLRRWVVDQGFQGMNERDWDVWFKRVKATAEEKLLSGGDTEKQG